MNSSSGSNIHPTPNAYDHFHVSPNKSSPPSNHSNSSNTHGHPSMNDVDSSSLHSKRSRISIACDSCRRKKIKCNGAHPCDTCKRNSINCTYQSPRRKSNNHTTYPPFSLKPFSATNHTVLSCSSNSSATISSSITAELTSTLEDMDHVNLAHDTSTFVNMLDYDNAHQSSHISNNAFMNPGSDSLKGKQKRSSTEDDQVDEELASMMTFLVSLEENGGINAMHQMGNSSGMHLLNSWTNNSGGVLLIPSIFRKHTPVGHELELPPIDVMELLLDFYYEYLHPFLPITERKVLYSSLRQPHPPVLLLNIIFALSSQVYEWLSPSSAPKDEHPIFASEIFFTRTRQLTKNIIFEPPCLEYIQGMLLLAFFETRFLHGSTWMISGIAVRMAHEIGLNRNMDHLIDVIPLSKLHRHIMKKTWAATCIVDRLMCAILGRPLTVHEEDCNMNWPNPEDEIEILPDGENDVLGVQLIANFVEFSKLCSILGRVLRNINSVQFRTRSKLLFSLPELHAALSEWHANLPSHLRYSFNHSLPKQSRYASFLNSFYYTCVILLYRPLISSIKARESPLFPQYLYICSTAVQAVIHIFHNRADDFFMFPVVSLYSLFQAITTNIVVLNSLSSMDESFSQRPSSGQRNVYPPTQQTRVSLLSALMKCLVVLSSMQDIWPAANRIGTVLEEFFITHKIPIPSEAHRSVNPHQGGMRHDGSINHEHEIHSDPKAVDEAYVRLKNAANQYQSTPVSFFTKTKSPPLHVPLTSASSSTTHSPGFDMYPVQNNPLQVPMHIFAPHPPSGMGPATTMGSTLTSPTRLTHSIPQSMGMMPPLPVYSVSQTVASDVSFIPAPLSASSSTSGSSSVNGRNKRHASSDLSAVLGMPTTTTAEQLLKPMMNFSSFTGADAGVSNLTLSTGLDLQLNMGQQLTPHTPHSLMSMPSMDMPTSARMSMSGSSSLQPNMQAPMSAQQPSVYQNLNSNIYNTQIQMNFNQPENKTGSVSFYNNQMNDLTNFATAELEEMMGVQSSMEFGGLGLDFTLGLAPLENNSPQRPPGHQRTH